MTGIPIPMRGPIAQAFAAITSRVFRPKCPDCGGKLVTHVSVYPYVEVEVEVFGDGQARVQTTARMVETRKQIVADLEHSIAGDRLNEYDEIWCENALRLPEDPKRCDFYRRAFDLEDELGKRQREAWERLGEEG